MREPSASPGMPLAPRRVPEAYARAEIASYPLTSLVAFESALLELIPSLGPEEDAPQGAETRALWTECEKTLAQHAGGWSLDRLIMTRDFFWFGCMPGTPRDTARNSISMRRYLRQLSQVHLEPYPGVTRLQYSYDANAFDAYTHYRWLNFALPEDLLLAATSAQPPPTEVDLEYPLLLRHLSDRGAAEVHHHVGAGMDFPLLWASLMAKLAYPTLRHDALKGPDLPFGRGETLLRWLLACAVARSVLAEFLLRAQDESGLRLVDFLARVLGAWPYARGQVLLWTLKALASGEESKLPEFYALRDLYTELHPESDSLPNRKPGKYEEVWRRCDPIAVRLGLRHPNGGERWLVRHGLDYLERREREEASRREREDTFDKGDRFFTRLFWQVQRVRCIYYRSVVQRPLTAGLQWFIRFYNRLLWGVTEPLSAVRAEVSYRVAGRGRPLSALEVRISPRLSPFELAGDLLELATSWRNVLEEGGGSRAGGREPEFGVLIHFTKDRDPELRWVHGSPPAGERETHADPHPSRSFRLGGRFADFYVEQVAKARGLVDLIRAAPQVLWLVRGLDVASDELSVPTWVLVPLYRFIHRESMRASVSPEAGGAPALRLTAHVGEDFRHLMEGLRRIFECVQYQLGRFGGRLGHATALGVEPRLWAESTGSVMMTTEERLWDLVFEWRLYSGYRIDASFRAEAPVGRPEQVENLIRQLSFSLFATSYEPQVLAELHHVLHRLLCHPEWPLHEEDESSLDAFARAEDRMDPTQVRCHRSVRHLLRAFREDRRVFDRGQDLVDITLDEAEVTALYAIQNALRRGVARYNIVVEVNPSSNLLIGDMLDLRNHPILRLFPPEREEGQPPPVSIAVGSDDPVTFSTWLLHEYSLLHEAALTAGYPERVVQTWLESIQKIGMDARFTVRWRPTALARTDELLRALRGYLMRPRHEA